MGGGGAWGPHFMVGPKRKDTSFNYKCYLKNIFCGTNILGGAKNPRFKVKTSFYST